MKTKEYYFDLIERHVWSHNSYWEDPCTESELRKNPNETVDILISYCEMILNNKKNIKKKFEDNPKNIQMMVNEIISLTKDDRELIREPIILTKPEATCGPTSLKYSHTSSDSNYKYLYFEEHIEWTVNDLLNECKHLKEILESENKIGNKLDKYLHKWYMFEGYEEGSDAIYISEINFKNDKYVFSGGYIDFTTENNYGDGVLINDVEDMDFSELQYSDECETVEDVIELLDSKDETTLKDIKQEIIDGIDDYWFDDKGFMYDYKQHSKK